MKKLKVGFDGREGLRLETEDGTASIGCTWGRDKRLCAERLVSCWNALAGIQNPAAIPEVVEALKRIAEQDCDTHGTHKAGVEYMQEVARTALAKLEGSLSHLTTKEKLR